jgi:hypothetical protein
VLEGIGQKLDKKQHYVGQILELHEESKKVLTDAGFTVKMFIESKVSQCNLTKAYVAFQLLLTIPFYIGLHGRTCFFCS